MTDRTTTREHLRHIEFEPQFNGGLWLDKFVRTQARSDKEARRDLVYEAAQATVPQAYTSYYRRWKQAISEQQPGEFTSTLRYAEATGRMIIGLGAESVLETAVALNRTYGVPYIPGSALKGLAAAYTRQYLNQELWGPQTAAYETLFGTTTKAGYVTFFDALYVPGTGKGEDKRPLLPDVITVHHSDYYQNKSAPAEWDSPNPVPFLTATGIYLLGLTGPLPWVDHTFTLLDKALADMGVGAKTNAGYGRMRLVAPPNESYQTSQSKESSDQTAQSPARPKMGRDVRGTIINSAGRGWIIQLDEGDFEITARSPANDRRYNVGKRVLVRITNDEGTRGEIRRLL